MLRPVDEAAVANLRALVTKDREHLEAHRLVVAPGGRDGITEPNTVERRDGLADRLDRCADQLVKRGESNLDRGRTEDQKRT